MVGQKVSPTFITRTTSLIGTHFGTVNSETVGLFWPTLHSY